MKKCYTLYLVFCILLGALQYGQAQVIITSRAVPQPYDTLEFLTDLLPNTGGLQENGPGQRWDFSSLSSPYIYQMILRHPSEGKGYGRFRRAQSMGITPEGYEVYYNWTASAMNIMGYYGYDFTGLGIKASSYYTKPYPVIETPLEYRKSIDFSTQLIMPLGRNQVPQSILRQLPYTPDSIRFVQEIRRTDKVDAEGYLDLQVQTYAVLRVTRTEQITKRLEVRSQTIPWQNVSDLFKEQRFMQPDSTKRILFLSNESKVPVAEFWVNPASGRINKVQYASYPYLNNVSRISKSLPDVYAYPNPTLGKLRFDFINLPRGYYKLNVTNVLGKQYWTQTYYLDQNKSIPVDLTFLPEGTYFYRLLSEQGETITTKKLIILTP